MMLLLAKLFRSLFLLLGVIGVSFLIVRYGSTTEHSNLFPQLYHFILHALRGEFGVSAVTGQAVMAEIMSRWPATLELGIVALSVSLVFGLPLGIIAAVYKNTLLDKLLMGISLLAYSVPNFWLALMLILFLSVGLDLTPVSGRLDIIYDVRPVTGFMLLDTLSSAVIRQYHFAAFFSAVSHLILPALVLASVPTAVFARVTRASLLTLLEKDFILSARARGVNETRVILIHALKNALAPILSVGGIYLIVTVITGSVVVEVIFGWPGIGTYIIQSIYARDYPVIQAFLLVMGMVVLCVNALITVIVCLVTPISLG